MEEKENQLRQDYAKLLAEQSDPAFYSRPDYAKVAKRLTELAKLMVWFDKRKALLKRQDEAEEILRSSDNELAALAQSELADIELGLHEAESNLQELLTPRDPNDERNAIFEIRAAAGGDESSLFAAELYRMYSRYCETHNLKVELLDESPSEAGGFKEISFIVKGDNAYGQLKFEAGVHRVQRVPETESQGRIHTSTVTVAVLPEAEESDIEIKDTELRIDVYRSGGHGGQSVNTTDSAVRITHLPTGLVVANQDEKSQTKNKAKAMSVLRSRLLQMKIDAENAKLSSQRRSLIGSGDRSEKVRTYNFPQDRITDHRIGYSRSNIPGAMNGQIDDLIEKLHKVEHELLAQES